MPWNYRVLSRTYSSGEVIFAIHEVYYDKQGKPKSCSEDPVDPYGGSVEDIKKELKNMAYALKQPVLRYEDF